MTLTEFYRLIRALGPSAGATEEDILAAESRLGGRLPDTLRNWFREANSFAGEEEMCMWRFNWLGQLYLISEVFPATREILVSRRDHPVRRMSASEYAIFCDALIYLPFYAVNIRPESPQFRETVSASEGKPSES